MRSIRERRVKDQRSGMDAWLYSTETDSSRNTLESKLPLILSVVGALGVAPFIVLRCVRAEWTAAVIDIVIVIAFVGLGIYLHRTRRVRFASVAIAGICIAGVISTVYLNGPQQVYWAYPVLVAVFYMLRPFEAIALAIVTVAAMLPGLLGAADPQSISTILVTIAILCSFAFAFSLVTNRQREKLIQLATKDPLTGAGNRRHLDNKLNDIVNGYQRTGTGASMLLLDLDDLKKINDRHGHLTGDQVLRRITEIIKLRIRVTDSVYRIGGDEFVVILEGQDVGRAAHLAEQLRGLVRTSDSIADQPVTISVGVAELKAEESAKAWLHRADKALYDAKREGRDTTNHAD